MSSHHVVKEKQEPALLILDLTGFEDENLGQLLEWSPTILVNDESAEKLYSLGIKFDVLITQNTTNFLQDNLKIITTNGDELKSGLQYLISEKYPAVNIITGKNSIDVLIAYAEQINVVIYNNYRKIYPVTTGFQKWKPAGEIIELLQIPASLEQSGLQQLNQYQFKTLNDGFFTLKFTQPFLFIAEEI